MDHDRIIKILLIGPRIVRNLGGPSLLPTTMQVLNRAFDNVEYTFISPTREDLSLAPTYGLQVIPIPKMWKILLPAILRKITGIYVGPANIRQAMSAFVSADLVIQTWGIWFADSLGSNKFSTRFNHSIYFIVAKIFRKPFVKYTADLGPFESRWNRFFAKLCLQNATDLILARNEITKNRLLKLGITTPIHVCPDTGFLLEPKPTPFSEQLGRIREKQPLIGMSVSYQAASQSGDAEKYIGNMAKVADHIIDTLGAVILFIPNELSKDASSDDRVFVENTIKRMVNNANVLRVEPELTASELKGVIAQCDLNVASRYHTIVASLSQKVPVAVVGWHEKYLGLLKLAGQEEYLVDVRSFSSDDLAAKFDHLWKYKDQRRVEIENALPHIINAIYMGGEITKNVYLEKIGRKEPG